MDVKQLRIGYVPMSKSLDSPGDRRRFVAYARARNLTFELATIDGCYDVVILSQKADISDWCDYPHGKIVYDFVDSYLAIPRANIKQCLRGFVWFLIGRHRRLRLDYRSALQNMCARADAVICTTDEQKALIIPYSDNVHLALDCHDTVVKKVKENYSCDNVFNLVWEGLPSNISQLKEIRNALQIINKRRRINLHVITDLEQPKIFGVGSIKSIDLTRQFFDEVVFHPWDEATCSEIICNCDLAIIPINLNDPFVRGKPENKLLLFWRIGAPVLTSATPAYIRAMKNAGLDGLVCVNTTDWVNMIARMMNSESFRRESGERGRRYTEKYQSKNIFIEKWDDVFKSLGFYFS
jgi:glycosyltransferase involved in cell wall biosynthesis